MTIILLSFVYGDNPDYESASGYYATGAGIAFIDSDVLPDLVVSNGNDMASQRNHIYFNSGGIPSVHPYEISSIEDYSGHLALGDVNGDGHEDLVIANFSGYEGGAWTKQVSLLYLWNNGSLDSIPAWTAPDSGRCFSVDMADVNGDGLMDAAFSCGNSYNSAPEPARLFLSDGNSLELYPAWQTDSVISYGLAFLDVDLDGDMDLFLGISGAPSRLYLNNGGMLDTIPAWQSDSSTDANQIFVEDMDGNGYPDVIVTNTYQYNSSKRRVEIYFNYGGVLETTPSWIYRNTDYFSTAVAGDIDGDGDADLVVGGWWSPIRIFVNNGGILDDYPSWEWQPSSAYDLVAERLLLFDVNGDGVVSTSDTFNYTAGNSLRLSKRPVFSLNGVLVNGLPLPPGSFSLDRETGYLFLDTALVNGGDQVVVNYSYSTSLDLFVSNWESSRGNFLFLNSGVQNKETVADRPRIFYRNGVLHIGNLLVERMGIWIYTSSGRLIFHEKTVPPDGRIRVRLNSGTYIVRMGDYALPLVVVR